MEYLFNIFIHIEIEQCIDLFYVLQVFDATNSTAERRKMIQDIVVNKWGYKLFFVESICDDPQIIEQNIMVGIFQIKMEYSI